MVYEQIAEPPTEKSLNPVRKKTKKLPVAISEEEFFKLIENTKKKHHKIAFLLGFSSGLRISEVLNLEARHIIFKDKKLLVELGKGGKDRIAPFPKGFKEEYLKYLPLKNVCGVRALQIAFKRNCKRAGLLEVKPSLHFH